MRKIGRRAALGGMAGLGVSLASRPALASARVGQPAPKFTITTFDHRKITSEELKGQVVVLNYWATWCAPCRNELIGLDEYMRAHKGTDLKLFAVLTESDVPSAKLKPLAALLSFPLAVDLRSWSYGIINNGVPTSYVIDRAGIIRYAEAGAFDKDSFAAVVEPLLAQPAPSPLPVAATTT